MKTLQSLFAAVAIVAISGAAHAAPAPAIQNGGSSLGPHGNRTFVFTNRAIDGSDASHEDTNFVSGHSITATSETSVDVRPYFYVQGSLGGRWKLNGWNANQSQAFTSELEIYHNANFNSVVSGFGKPENAAGDKLDMTVDASFTSNNPNYVGDLATGDAANFNGSNYPVLQTNSKGYMKLKLVQQLTAPTASPAGTYTVTPNITFTSSAN
jgi:hypothetical protein